MNNYFDDLLKATGNEYGSKVSDGIEAGDVSTYVDTGSYILNALISGDIYGGIPSNKITALAGETATNSFLQTILAAVFCILSLSLL